MISIKHADNLYQVTLNINLFKTLSVKRIYTFYLTFLDLSSTNNSNTDPLMQLNIKNLKRPILLHASVTFNPPPSVTRLVRSSAQLIQISSLESTTTSR